MDFRDRMASSTPLCRRVGASWTWIKEQRRRNFFGAFQSKGLVERWPLGIDSGILLCRSLCMTDPDLSSVSVYLSISIRKEREVLGGGGNAGGGD